MINLTKSTSHVKAREGDSVLDPERSWGIKNKGKRFLLWRREAGDVNEHFGQEGLQKTV